MLLAYLLGAWAMAVNEHFELLVRIQTDRGHRVVTSGPYRIVRHPGYLAAIVGGLTSPLILGSLWAFAPVVAGALLFTARTALEDRTLREELAGYQEYAARTRHRLLPGIW
jgi:protein-S-isoprenylcysteine O-methyltransferase Ste14